MSKILSLKSKMLTNFIRTTQKYTLDTFIIYLRLFYSATMSAKEKVKVESRCDRNKYFEWYDSQTQLPSYVVQTLERDILKLDRSDKYLWDIFDIDSLMESTSSSFSPDTLSLSKVPSDFILTNGQAIELTSVFCQESLRRLKLDLRGGFGPVADKDIHKVMCSTYCQLNDRLREEAMIQSKCSCLELSKGSESSQYFVEGDWCYTSSARILCAELERCETWNCNINDFHCPRREYDLKFIEGVGYGKECSDCSIRMSFTSLHIPLLLVYFLFALFMFH